MSNILVITNYWHPWNNSGTFRWLHLSKYIDFDVLTSKRPGKGFYDDTMFETNTKIYRYGNRLPAFLSGLYLSIISWFIRADKYVYTSPPETLLVGAWVNQMLGREVYVDIRDKIDRGHQRHKWLIPIYQWLYKRIKNVCVCMQFFDKNKPVIRHGYDDIEKCNDNFPSRIMLNGSEKLTYAMYCVMIQKDAGRDYSGRDYKDDNSLSLVTLRHLGNPILGKENLHPECFEFEPESWEKIAEQMKGFLNENL